MLIDGLPQIRLEVISPPGISPEFDVSGGKQGHIENGALAWRVEVDGDFTALLAGDFEQHHVEACAGDAVAMVSDRFLQNQPAQLSEKERGRIRELANDMPALWHAPTTSPAERKEIIRCLVEKVVVHVKGDSEYVGVTIHWQGGFTSQQEIVRPVASYARMRDFPQLCERLREMRKQGLNAAQMADTLNREGFSPPKRSNPFSEELVRQLLCRQGISNEKTCSPPLAAHAWWLPDLARELKLPAGKLRGWIERGWLHARQTSAQHLWIVWADRDELRRLRKLVARSHRGVTSQPPELTTLKNRS